MEPPLPLKSVVLFIACGGMVCIMVFIFAKRQITRFALKSRGPHVLIGVDAPKKLRQEIERRLQRTKEVKYEPALLNPRREDEEDNTDLTAENCHFLYRFKAVDSINLLDEELSLYSPHIRRQAGQHTLRTFLLDIRQDGPLEGIKLELIERFTEAYDHARHDPMEFGVDHYHDFLAILAQLTEHIRNKKNQKDANDIVTDEIINTVPEIDTNVNVDTKDSIEDLDPVSKQVAETNTTIEEIKDLCEKELSTEKEVQVTYRPSSKKQEEGVLQMVPGSSTSGSTGHVDGSSGSGSARNSGNFETSV